MLYGYDVILIEQLNLMEGQDMALLIDTGFGTGNLRGFVEKLTNKPIIVANTHFHPDHAAGNGEFERAYMSEGARWDAPSVYNSGAVPFDFCAGQRAMMTRMRPPALSSLSYQPVRE